MLPIMCALYKPVVPIYWKKTMLAKKPDLVGSACNATNRCYRRRTEDLPFGYVFPETGLASFSTNLERVGRSSMFSFRSSPYGSTSHALANQNAFNTFWSGQPLFYSSGHHISFIDKHSMYCHRATRAHNTILVNGIGQRIGTEGYGWIPRYYVGEKIGYVLGDASNAYGKVISKSWLQEPKRKKYRSAPKPVGTT